MADSGGSEKTEKATPKKKRDERKKGNVFSSKDLVAAFFILIMFGTLRIMGSLILSTCYDCITYWFSLCDGRFIPSTDNVTLMLTKSLTTFAIIAGPPLIVSCLVNVLFTGAQTGFIASGEALKFKMNRLNPIEGIKKMFSLRSIVELIKSLLKIAIIGAIIYTQIKKNFIQISTLYNVDVMSALIFLCSTIFSIIMTIGAIFIGLGIADLFYQWFEHEKQMKMTKQEVKEEYKQMEGDPQIRAQIKQKQREMAQQRMMADVPTADVIIRNPTHIAIAIKYDPKKSGAPVVVAKGADYVAEKIIAIATENHIMMTENKPLARALYDEVKLGKEIPSAFYQEVAEILAWVYDIEKKTLDS